MSKPGKKRKRVHRADKAEEKAAPTKKLTLRMEEEKRRRYRAYAASEGMSLTDMFVEAAEARMKGWYVVGRGARLLSDTTAAGVVADPPDDRLAR